MDELLKYILGSLFLIVAVILIWLLSIRLSRQVQMAKTVQTNRKYIDFILSKANTIYWLRISKPRELEVVQIPTTSSQSQGFTNLLMAARDGDITILEPPKEHDSGYSAKASSFKTQAQSLLNGDCPNWAMRYLPSNAVLNSLLPMAVRDQKQTIWSPAPEEDTVQKVVEPNPPPETVETHGRGGHTLFQGSGSGSTMFDSGISTETGGGTVVQANDGAKPVIIPGRPTPTKRD